MFFLIALFADCSLDLKLLLSGRSLLDFASNQITTNQDYVLFSRNANETNRLYQELNREGSPLDIINKELSSNHFGRPTYNQELINRLLDGLSLMPQTETGSKINLLTVHYISQYVKRFIMPKVLNNGDNPFSYPSFPKAYQPATTLASPHMNFTNSIKLTELNASSPFFAQRYFSDITRGANYPWHEIDLPIRQNIEKGSSDTILTIFPLGRKNFDLLLPVGFRALDPDNPNITITKSLSGGYKVRLKEYLEKVFIPVVIESSLQLSRPLKELYLRPVGFEKNEFPTIIHEEIFNKYTISDSPLKIARAIQETISQNYLYAIQSQVETDPIAALESGKFRCDMAAFIMIGILRDFYQIPSRIVGGLRSKTENDQKSYVVVPDIGHAAVEIFYQGKWHFFDPTPINQESIFYPR